MCLVFALVQKLKVLCNIPLVQYTITVDLNLLQHFALIRAVKKWDGSHFLEAQNFKMFFVMCDGSITALLLK